MKNRTMYQTLNLRYLGGDAPHLRVRLEPGKSYGVTEGVALCWMRLPDYKRLRIEVAVFHGIYVDKVEILPCSQVIDCAAFADCRIAFVGAKLNREGALDVLIADVMATSDAGAAALNRYYNPEVRMH